MWKNIGKTIKNFAKVYFWINLAVNLVVLGFNLYGYVNYMMQGSLLMSVLNVLMSFLGNTVFVFLLYGLGELVDHAKAIRDKLEETTEACEEEMPANEEAAEEASETIEEIMEEATEVPEEAETIK